MQSVALLGLGTMGRGMASNLTKAGFPLSVYNRRSEVARQWAHENRLDEKIRLENNPADAVSSADVVISMLADDDAAKSVWLGAKGAMSAVRPETILVESSTVSPAWIAELNSAGAAKQCRVLDAPVTGSKVQAANGELLFLVGGDADTLDLVRPVLQAMSRAIVHVGPSGSGACMKLVNNFLSGVQAASLAEALSMAMRLGISEDVTYDVLTNGAPGSPLVKTLTQRIRGKNYDTQFALQLMAKDLSYAIKLSEETGLPLHTARGALKVFERGLSSGLGEKDMSAVFEAIKP
ncbi:NAD(P)-dependent oxidoreductase [Alloacidobacterium dinghuense]|uniref:NAD(P)-dependent oxidoreductase n=1 Tax=Alloacidobacterium dinghuense TaxID=2763107 RepID=A0A7G8BLX5_9BACT|nr:NAD(P)-dependent oxidoreductase [Alloacidobacterium dinghuense]QNI33545.1 NAD(P)-dependent oxidoreductase [Alloacidobacterium dinghuense]